MDRGTTKEEEKEAILQSRLNRHNTSNVQATCDTLIED